MSWITTPVCLCFGTWIRTYFLCTCRPLLRHIRLRSLWTIFSHHSADPWFGCVRETDHLCWGTRSCSVVGKNCWQRSKKIVSLRKEQQGWVERKYNYTLGVYDVFEESNCFVQAIDVIFLHQNLVVSTKSRQKYYRCYIFKAMNPLFAFVALSTHIHESGRQS